MGAIDKLADEAAAKLAAHTLDTSALKKGGLPTPDPAAAALQALTPGLGKPPAPGDSGPGGTAPVAPGPLPYDSHTAPVAPNETPKAPEPIKPVIKPVPSGISGPVEQVPAVNAEGPAPETVAMPSVHVGEHNLQGDPAMAAKSANILQAAKDDPKIGDKLLSLAQTTGKSLLELVQGFAKGYSGSDIKLASQVRQEEKTAKTQQAHELEMQQAQVQANQLEQKSNQDFMERTAQIQNDYLTRMFTATTDKEKAAVAQQQQYDSGQNEKNRSLQLKIAEIMRTPTMWEQAGGLQQAIAQALSAGKVQ